MQSVQIIREQIWVDQMPPRSAQEGAETAIWLATRDFDPSKDKTGLLWEDRQVVDW